MSENKTHSEDRTGPRLSGPLSALGGPGLPITVGTVAFHAWTDMVSEAARFVLERQQQNARARNAILACKSLDDMWQVQADFFTVAREQYAAEPGRMLDLMNKAAASGMRVSKRARRYDDVPL
ncbi:phasin family protein [Meridianimarinicoccus sp. RP-17]|uniref:phasin family protein n=1 Tax=Meridianimarinicoccus zhengii TaxID=2056810 RepID=UPI000DAB6DA0|nr:hypothetical protein [Phycocomes zhengii]